MTSAPALPPYLLYLHGFRSSPKSMKARVMQAALEERGLLDRLICPQLPASPKAAFALALDLAAQHAPQLIVLDVSLPDIDGLSVLRRLRQSAITRNTPVLMITADASTLTRLALQDAGATAVLSKPINVPSFLAHLDHCFPEPV